MAAEREDVMQDERIFTAWLEGRAPQPPKGARVRSGLTLLLWLAAILILVIVLPVLFTAFDKFHPSTVRRISAGDSRTEVVRVLGVPDKSSLNAFEYSGIHFWRIPGTGNLINEYGSSLTASDLVDYMTRRWKLPYIRVEFDSFDTVNGLFLDADHPKENVQKRKQLKSCSLVAESVLPFTETTLWYTAEYTDGSYYMGSADSSFYSADYGSVERIFWNDPFGNVCEDTVRIGGEAENLFSGEDWSVTAAFELNVQSEAGLQDFSSQDEVGKLIRRAILAEGIETLPNYTFDHCSALEEVQLPESLRLIGNFAFEDCGSLQSINLPAGLESIGDQAFNFCNSLRSLSLPDGVTSLGAGAFAYCSSLESVQMPADLQSLGRGAFESCSSLEAIDIPDSVTFIGESVFSGCYELREVHLPERLTSIKASLFDRCINLRSIDLPDSVTSIENHAFLAAGLEQITFPQKLTSIGYGAFSDSHLTEVVLPEGVLSVAENAFSACNQLREVRLPQSLRSIGEGAFENCSVLASINFPASLQELGARAFAYCPSIRSVSLPGSIGTVGDSAFINGSSLESVTLGEGITAVDAKAFFGCGQLLQVSLPSTLESIGSEAFAHCGDSRGFSVAIPASVTYIGAWAFWQSWLAEADFAQTQGWYEGNEEWKGIPISAYDLADPQEAALLLREEFSGNIWRRF